jgi:hypothetical protein
MLRFAREFAALGHTVTLVGLTSGTPSDVQEFMGDGSLRVIRIARKPYDRSRWLHRALWTLTANIAVLWAAWPELRRAIEVRFTGSPPYLLHFVMPVAKALRIKTRYRISDFHPECLIAALGRSPIWLKPVTAATMFWRRRVDVIEVLGEDQRRRIQQCSIPASRINLVRDPSPVSFSESTVPAAVPSALDGKKVILYSGNWGVAHDYATFVEGFTRFSSQHSGVAGVWLNATGKRADVVESELRARSLCYARTTPVPIDQVAGVLLAADLHLITLLDAFVGYVLPSKVYGCVASGRPVLFIGSSASDVHLICRGTMPAAAYRRADVGDVESVVRYLGELLSVRSLHRLERREKSISSEERSPKTARTS